MATRGSPLALRQAELVADALAVGASSAPPRRVTTELVVVETAGDLHRDRPIGAIGGQGAFVTEVEQALIDGRADLAVHSAKDLPSSCGSGELEIVAVPRRADPRDALVGRALAELGPGAHVATGAPEKAGPAGVGAGRTCALRSCGATSPRASARCPAAGAVVIAYAALERLGLTGLAAEVLPTSTMLPQVGQGALAIQCRVRRRGGGRGGALDRRRRLASLPRRRAGLLGRARRRLRAARRRSRRDRLRRRGGAGRPRLRAWTAWSCSGGR